MMTHKIGYVFIYFLIIHSYVHCKKDETPLLLIVAYDGLRYDFLNEVLTPNLWQLAKKGVWSPNGVKNQVVTVTAPSFYTIVTGLYQENHGIIGNKFYDPVYNEFFDYWNMENETLHSTSLHPKWYSGEPIWQVLYNRKTIYKIEFHFELTNPVAYKNRCTIFAQLCPPSNEQHPEPFEVS